MSTYNQFECQICGVKIGLKRNFKRHMESQHSESKQKKCLHCEYKGRADAVKRHQKLVHKLNEEPEKENTNARIRRSGGVQMPSEQISRHTNVVGHITTEMATQTEPNEPASTSTAAIEEPETGAANDEPAMSTVEIVEEEAPETSNHEDGAEAESDGNWRVEDSYSMQKVKEFYSHKWKTTMSDYKININPLPNENWQAKLTSILEHILSAIRAKAAAGAVGRIVVFINGAEHPIHERARTIDELDLKALLAKIESVLNSNDSADLGQGIRIHTIFTELPLGGTGARGMNRPGEFHKRTTLDSEEWASQKRSLLNPAGRANDNLCMARCIIVGQAMVNHECLRDVDGSPVDFKYLCNWKSKLQRTRAEDLHRNAGVLPMGKKCGLDELRIFQNYLEDQYQVILYEDGCKEPAFVGPTYKSLQIYLYYSNHHYRLINPKMLGGLFVCDHHCTHCFSSWNGNTRHQCKAAGCSFCHSADCENKSTVKCPRTCDDCDEEFYTVGCFALHKKRTCQKLALCPNCKKMIKRDLLDPPGYKPPLDEPQPDSKHMCLQVQCRYCRKHYMPGHHILCAVQKPKGAEKPVDENAEEGLYELLGDRDFEENNYEDKLPMDGSCREEAEKGERKRQDTRYIFGDFESEIDGSFHNANLLCLEDESGKQYKYTGLQCANKFIEDCFGKSKGTKRKHGEPENDPAGKGPPAKRGKKDKKQEQEEDTGFRNCCFIFHNFSGYDGYPILNALHQQKIRPTTIFRGSRLLTMSLKQRGIRFLDSFLHSPMPLSSFPRAYGIKDAVKGQFPYKLATKANRQYRGQLPAIEWYDGDNKTTKQRKELASWHEEEKQTYIDDPTKVYDLQKENEKYCRNDIFLLKEGVREHRLRMMDIFDNEDPMRHITLPSYCNYVYRKLMMPENSIAIIPPRGFGSMVQSAKALAWLEWLSFTLGLQIFHQRNSSEIKVGPYRVDGLAFTKSNYPCLFEFNGCCHWCIRDRKKQCKGKSMDECHEHTLKKEAFLRRAGYNLTSIYECEMEEQMKHNPEMRRFIMTVKQNFQNKPALNPRDSLRGGRTNSVRKFYRPKLELGEELRYYDVNSLYPSVNCSTEGEEWPIGRPDIYFAHNHPPVEEIFGLIRGTFAPPDRLFHPVLGILAHNKLVYGLCETCVDNCAKTYCTHTEGERQISGTFVSPEVYLALKKGYKTISIDEVYHWPKERRSKTLFRGFMLRAYRCVESSGWPASIQELIDERGLDDLEVQEKIDVYVTNVKEELDVDIRKDKVELNPARRQASKLVLNNFWGFLAKTNNPDQTTYVDSLAEFYRLLTTKDVGCYYMVNDEVMVVNWREKENNETADGKSNVILAAFTTAYARIRLYRFLDIVGDRCVYKDTDSVIWIFRPGTPSLETGNLLGELKDEILDEYSSRATIGAYGAAGPKSYSLLIVDKNTREVIDYKRKMKGIKPTFKVDEILPAPKLMDLIEKEYSVHVPQRILRRNKQNATLQWKEMNKIVQSTFSKRLPPDNLEDATDPIGSRRPSEI